MLDPHIRSARVTGSVYDADSELAQHLDTGATALSYGPLQQRHENEVRHEDRESRERHPWIEVNYIGEHGEQDACLQQGLRVDLRRFSGEGLAHSAAIFSNCAGLVKSRAEWRRTGL